MDVNTILCWYYRRCKNRRKIRRKYWVHPILRQRQNLGAFHALMSSLREDDTKFYTYFRMSKNTFDYLLQMLGMDLRKQDTNMRKAISPEEKLAITIRYLASGLSYEDLHFSYRMGKSTISNVVAEVTQSIWNNLYEEFMPLPNTEEEWEKIASGFNVKANFPHCLGAVDGKHIRLRKPSNSGSVYMNYKDFFSMVLLAVVDSDYRFLYINVGAYGKECDSSIFKESSFWKMFTEGRLNIPEPRPLFTDSEVKVPYVIIGDEGFGLHTHLLRPYGGTHLDRDKRIFNYRLTRARRYVECAFGILANKWRILHRPIDLKRETAISVVKACTVLHNLILKKQGIEFEKDFNFESLLRHEVSPSVESGHSVRNEFMNYFLSDAGSVPWQDSKI